MAAYIIAKVRVTDPEKYAKYKLLTPAAIEDHGGTFIVRGASQESLEGPEDDRGMVVVEFAEADDARAFYSSAAYTEARAVREGGAEIEMVLVEGV